MEIGMKKVILILILAITTASGQEAGFTTIEHHNFLDEVKKHDVSDLWTCDSLANNGDSIVSWKRPPALGFIGKDFQRIKIKFLSVIQNPKKPLEYMIYGKSNVNENICPFQGNIIIDTAQIYGESDDYHFIQGSLSGRYTLYEDTDYYGTGVFEGVFSTNFYILKSGKIRYDDLCIVDDSFSNNQFEGTWTSYNNSGENKGIKICNWGDFRIPGNIFPDNGVAEFVPDKKIHEHGWGNYFLYQLYVTDSPYWNTIKAIEEEKWWLDKEKK
jgi:hypothetical protein